MRKRAQTQIFNDDDDPKDLGDIADMSSRRNTERSFNY